MLQELGIIPLRISLPFRLNHVNCFLAEGEEGWTVIDAGLHHPYSIETWEKVVPDKEITNIIVTHYHPDHYGYVGRLQELTGARVWMTRQDAHTAGEMWTEERFHLIRDQYAVYGVPDEMVKQMVHNTEQFIQFVTPHPRIDRYLEEGQTFILGKHEYEVIFTPGHAEGMISLFNRKESFLLSADHVLPKITPNISYWFVGDANPLQTYLNSLEKIKALDPQYIIPSHGQPFRGGSQRIEEIKSHHEHRLQQMLEDMGSGKNAYEICLDVFGTGLNPHEMRFAVGETIAHLEYLHQEGLCEKIQHHEKWVYVKK